MLSFCELKIHFILWKRDLSAVYIQHWDKNTESAKGENGCVRLVGNNSLAKKVKSINQNRKNLLAPLLYKQFITQAKKKLKRWERLEWLLEVSECSLAIAAIFKLSIIQADKNWFCTDAFI